MTDEIVRALKAFSSENADIVVPVEAAVMQLRSTLELLGGKSVPVLTPEGAIRQQFIENACTAAGHAIQHATEALLSAAVSLSEQRAAARRIDRVSPPKLATAKD